MKYYMAPMEGITGYVFRNVHHSVYPAMDKYFTPFLSPTENGKLTPKEYRDIDPKHNSGLYIVPQILTNNAVYFIQTARTLRSMGYEEVNLNLGCPSGTVVSKGRGSGFLAFPDQLDAFLYEIFSGLDMKISIKTRLGKTRPEEFEHLLEIYNQYELEELIIHPRVQQDQYKNTPCMDMFSWAFSHSRSPVCYNGDIFRAEDKKRIEALFPSLPAVMLGRGLVACPGLLHDPESGGHRAGCLPEDLGGSPLSGEKQLLREFHDRLYEAYRQEFLKAAGAKVVLFKMKEIWCYLCKAFDGGEKYGKKIKKAQTLGDYETAVSAMFRNCPLCPGLWEIERRTAYAAISGNRHEGRQVRPSDPGIV